MCFFLLKRRHRTDWQITETSTIITTDLHTHTVHSHLSHERLSHTHTQCLDIMFTLCDHSPERFGLGCHETRLIWDLPAWRLDLVAHKYWRIYDCATFAIWSSTKPSWMINNITRMCTLSPSITNAFSCSWWHQNKKKKTVNSKSALHSKIMSSKHRNE